MPDIKLIATQNPWWSSPEARFATKPRRRLAFAELRQKLLSDDPKRAIVLLGPRQVGKTELLRQLVNEFLDQGWRPENITHFDFKDARYDRLSTPFEIANSRPRGSSEQHPRLLVLDELTSGPRWDTSLKQLVDEARRQPPRSRDRIIVTDSAASLLRSGAIETLQGRTDELRIHGLLLVEALHLQALEGESPTDVALRDPVATQLFLKTGGLPEHIGTSDLRLAYERIREDIANKAIARDLGREKVDVERVTSLFQRLASNSGALFAAEKVASSLQTEDGAGTSAKTVRGWVEKLEGASLLDRLIPWSPGRRNTPRQPGSPRARPKIYADDHGYVAAFSPLPAPLQRPESQPRIFETAVFTHLRALCEARPGMELRFYRHGNDAEIDFVLLHDDATIGVEVTSSEQLHKKRTRMSKAAKRAQLDYMILVHGAGTPSKASEGFAEHSIESFLLDPELCIEGGLQWIKESR